MQEFLAGLAEIIEVDVDQVVPELELASTCWDSLAVVSTIALIDDLFNTVIDGQALNNCNTVADLVALINQRKKV